MYGQVWGEGLPRKRKNLANSYTATRVNVYFKLSSFFPMLFQRQNRDINGSLQILDFFQESFLKRGLHVSMNGKFIFSGKFIFRWRGHLIGVDSALMAEGGVRGEEAHGVGGTLLMPLPTRGNPGLCCNRIKKKHELQYALENLQEKDLNFTRKGTSSQMNF